MELGIHNKQIVNNNETVEITQTKINKIPKLKHVLMTRH